MLRSLHYLLVAVFACVAAGHGNAEPRASLQEDLGRAYGFYIGQKLTLEGIGRDHPSLASSAALAQREFDVVFKSSYENVEKTMKGMVGEQWASFAARFPQTAAAVSEKEAARFIEQIALRTKGEMDTRVLQTFLTYRPDFQSQPAAEFVAGFKRVFRTTDHPKAKGLDLQIEYPASWVAAEGKRPNVIQLLTSESGRGFASVTLMVRDIPVPMGYVVSPEEVAELFSAESMKAMVPQGGTFVSSVPIVMDRQAGAMLVFDQAIERLDLSIPTRTTSFVTLYSGKMIFLQCAVASPNRDGPALKAAHERLTPLFKLIANSFVLQDQY